MNEPDPDKRTCSRCQYGEPSFNLLWCVIHEITVRSDETCHSFEKKYDYKYAMDADGSLVVVKKP